MTVTALIISTNNPPRGALEKKILKTGIFSRTVVCASGEEALSVLNEQTVDMIFWAFGTIDESVGWLETLHLNRAWTDIPLLVFTKEDECEQRLRGLELGACDTVTFVTPPAELTARIRGHLKRSEQILQLRNRRAELSKMALSDSLTGLGNRASFDLRLGQEVSRTRRSGIPFGLMLIDLDHFKWFNDCYGHQTGDMVLKSVARVLAKTAREADVVCRYGGEEFALILPGTSAASAKLLADRIHQELVSLSSELWHNASTLTASIGLTCFDENCSNIGAYELISEADSALYQAKNKGRNCTVKFQPATTQLPHRFDYEVPVGLSVQAL